jgi:hypothetical protein
MARIEHQRHIDEMNDLLAPIKEAQEDVAEAIEEKLHYLQEQQSYQAQMLKQLLEHHRIQLQAFHPLPQRDPMTKGKVIEYEAPALDKYQPAPSSATNIQQGRPSVFHRPG